MRGAWFSALLLLGARASAATFSPSPLLDFTREPDAISTHCRRSIDHAAMALQTIANRSDQGRTFHDTPAALDGAGWDLSDKTASDWFLKYVSVSSAARDAANDCEIAMEKFDVETFSRTDLYSAVSSYARGKPRLSGEAQKLLAEQLRDFKRSGLGLPAKKRARVKQIKLRLTELEALFRKNLNEVKDALPVGLEELDGLPQDFISRLERRGDKYLVTLDAPDYFPFMDSAKNPSARQLLENLYSNRAAKENLPVLAEILRLRREAAKLLGYYHHADYVLEERMAKNAKTVSAFLGRLEGSLLALGREQLRELLALKREQEGPLSDGILHAWDWRFYDNFLKKNRYEVDQEKIREYFPLETVTSGMLSTYELLFGLKFRRVENAAVWHPDVTLYEVKDAADGPALGHFYLDLFPREGKYKHAAVWPLIKARLLADDTYQTPVSAMLANFNKPAPGRPSLLKHKEVETFFHEFGHVMHSMLTQARFGRFSGTKVARDFVEAPSQMLENWVWDPAVLPALSGHYQDASRKLPPELLEKMLAAKNVNSGLFYLRQVFLAAIDQRYHSDLEIPDTSAEYARLMERISLIPMSHDTHPEAGFGHLVGYDAGYYGYLWSKVFAQDMFTRFEAQGVLNPAIGRLYRETILAPGGSLDEAALLQKFLGRKPNEKAFLKSIGLNSK